MAPDEAVGGADDLGKKKSRKRQPAKCALAMEPESKKPKAAALAIGSAGDLWCPIHNTSKHDLKDCRKVPSLAGAQQKAWKDAKKEGQGGDRGGCFKCGKPSHFIRDCPSGGGGGCGGGIAGRDGGHGGRGGRNRPSRGGDDHGDQFAGEEEEAERYQEARDVACVDGGAFVLSSHAAFKRLSRELNAIQPGIEAQHPLKWSAIPITFDAADHPDRTSGVGDLPLVVSPTINNVKVTKMLVDGGAGLNLISAKLLR